MEVLFTTICYAPVYTLDPFQIVSKNYRELYQLINKFCFVSALKSLLGIARRDSLSKVRLV